MQSLIFHAWAQFTRHPQSRGTQEVPTRLLSYFLAKVGDPHLDISLELLDRAIQNFRHDLNNPENAMGLDQLAADTSHPIDGVTNTYSARINSNTSSGESMPSSVKSTEVSP